MKPPKRSRAAFGSVCSSCMCKKLKLCADCTLHQLRALQGSRQEKRCVSRPTLQSGKNVDHVVSQGFEQMLVVSLVFLTLSCMSRFCQAQAIALSVYGMCQTERRCRPGWMSSLMLTAPMKFLRFDTMQPHATLYFTLLTYTCLHCLHIHACH